MSYYNSRRRTDHRGITLTTTDNKAVHEHGHFMSAVNHPKRYFRAVQVDRAHRITESYGAINALSVHTEPDGLMASRLRALL